MLIIGCDLHTRFQVIAYVELATGEIVTCRLEHENGEARKFYAGLGEQARVGIEATGCTQWFERLLAEWGTSCGWAIRGRFGRGRCGGRRRTRATRSIFWIC